ncbi:MAG: 3-phosphoglycerate dehydrogenase [Atopobiaceae bacterium]|nr:3-phosphoglycerate dehydrogenase [Atopobiaceae bacterium]
MFKLYCMNNIASKGLDALGSNFELCDRIDDAQAILVRSADLHGVELPSGLLAIARAGAGVNNIPLERCAERGIPVFNTPGANANGVKELVLAGLLLSARDIVGSVEWVRSHASDPNVGVQAESAKKQFAGNELSGKTLGVIGLGAIGAMVANTARHLGMQVVGHDPYLSVQTAWQLDRHVRHVDKLEDIFASCDYITIHVPANDETHHMIGAEEISRMKEGVVFLNYSRDSLVDEEAMAQALASGQVKHYMSDFPNERSVAMEGAVVTTHLGASTKESEDNCAVMAACELREYLENGNLLNSVNFGRVDMGQVTTDARITILHRNIPNMIGQFSTMVANSSLNIENMQNRKCGQNASTLIELSGALDETLVSELEQVEGVYRVRMVTPSMRARS